MQHLRRDSNVADADAHYAAILDAHSGLTQAQSVALNARLVLLLANHIGDADVLREAIEAAQLRSGKQGKFRPAPYGTAATLVRCVRQ